MLKQIITQGIRSDEAGDGHFGASRGSRTHRGVDYDCDPVAPVLCLVAGKVTKLGYCYADDLSWRYVQVTDKDSYKHRFFYVTPTVQVGDFIGRESIIGVAQDITERYPSQGMNAHVHYEIKTTKGEYLDPEEFHKTP